MAETSKPGLFIGCDFGTTYSGVSYTLTNTGTSNKTSQPEVVTSWPSVLPRNSDRQKVPSKIHYDKEAGTVSWGYNIPISAEPIQWFKLLLLDEGDVPQHLRTSPYFKIAKKMARELDKTATEIIGDYLGLIWKHSLEVIEAAVGRNLVRSTPIHVTLTVPAIWKAYARERMRQAAGIAGMLEDRPCGNITLEFISEPEAAVLSTIPELGSRGDLQPADSFVVCDCGGGTVDIVSYSVKQAEPLQFSECVEGEGALCGAMFLDEGFEALLRRRIAPDDWDNMTRSELKKMLNREWENGIKADFSGSDNEWVVDVPRGSKRIEVTLSGADIRNIFDPITSEIYNLIVHQVDAVLVRTGKAPKFVMLVGGFGRCSYICRYLGDRLAGRVDILQSKGERPWSAISRGATLFGVAQHIAIEQAVLVQSRVCRFSYGFSQRSRFIEGEHDIRDKKWCDIRGQYVAENQVQWVLKRVSVLRSIDLNVLRSRADTDRARTLGAVTMSR